MKLALFIFAAALSWGQCTTGANGWCNTGLSSIQNNILGPLIPIGASPWTFGDATETGVAASMVPAALSLAPALGTALSGTISFIQGMQTVTTTANLTGPLAGQSWVAIAWNSIDGTSTGRALCPIQSVTSTTITCSENFQEPSSSGVTAYLLPAPTTINGIPFDFQQWTTENPSTVWPYYDVAIGLYRLYYRTLNTVYLTQARQYADINWQWTLDHGFRSVAPRASTMLSQFFRALDGHPERLPGLYAWIALEEPRWNPTVCPNCDNREIGYETLNISLGAKVDTDPTRHAQYCSWLTSFVTTWNSKQAADGSFPENEYSQNPTFVSAPKSFTLPIQYGAAPWREFVNATSLESAYESLNDTSTQGCNNQTLAAATLLTITNLVTWIHNYGRDTSNRGVFYEVNFQSQDQNTVFRPGGTVSISLTSTALTGVGTDWVTAGYCDGTHFIGIESSLTVYKIGSCADNTHATLTVAYGLYGEISNASGSQYSIAPAASSTCNSSASFCFGGTAPPFNQGDRNLVRAVPGATGWLYNQTLNTTYLAWTNEWLSATLGGPTAGLTSTANISSFVLPCSGPACDGLVTDVVMAAFACGSTMPINTPPCVYGGVGPFSANTGKNFGEAFGAPGIDNALAWRLVSPGGGGNGTILNNAIITGAIVK
jgi:hypothetical protein